MNYNSWNIIKNSKNFNVTAYRRSLVILIGSLGLNCIIALLLFYVFLTQHERDYYATNGETWPVQLTAMRTVNKSSKALLDSEPLTEPELKVIPQ